MEKSNRNKVLVVESDAVLRKNVLSMLSDAGYEVSSDWGEGMKSVVAFGPDAVILGANPPQLDCCDLLSEIKGSERTQNIRVLMLAPGGSAERTRGLDLGADDVLSLPFEPHELLSRLRSQLRNRGVIEDLRQQARTVEENQIVADQVITAVHEERRTLRTGGILGGAALLVSVLVFLVFYHRTQ